MGSSNENSWNTNFTKSGDATRPYNAEIQATNSEYKPIELCKPSLSKKTIQPFNCTGQTETKEHSQY